MCACCIRPSHEMKQKVKASEQTCHHNSTRLTPMDALGEAPLPLELQLKDIPVLEIICINLHLFFKKKNVNVPSFSCSASYPVW